MDGPLTAAESRGRDRRELSFLQARIVFDHLLSFMGERIQGSEGVEAMGLDPIRSAASPTYRRVRALHRKSDPKRMHGLAPVLVLADEPAQWGGFNFGGEPSGAQDRARQDPGFSRLIALGTRPDDEGHWFARMLSGERALDVRGAARRSAVPAAHLEASEPEPRPYARPRGAVA